MPWYLFGQNSTGMHSVGATSSQTVDDSLMSEIKVLASTALKPTLDEVLPDFERMHRHSVTLTFAPSVQIAKKVAAGEPCDVVLVTGQQFDDLVSLGKVVKASRKDIASSVIGLAVRAGATKPDISAPDGFKRAMLAAKSIAMSNPGGGGASGAHLARIFEALGIAEAMRPKLTYGPGGPNGLIGTFVQSGQVELGLQQIPELMAVAGIEVVGPLPRELQMETLFSIGLASNAKDPETGKSLVSFMAGAPVAAVLKQKGMNSV
jgi:molybdate transport system substrate-binding protein